MVGLELVLVADQARVEQHRAAAEMEEIVLHLEAVHRLVLGDDRLDQQPQRRDIPLAVAELEERPATRLRRILLEIFVEAAARGKHAQVVVEHDERLG